MTGLVPRKVRREYYERQVISFLKELMPRHKRLPSQLATDLGLSHPTVGRWLSGTDVPKTRSCQKLEDHGRDFLEEEGRRIARQIGVRYTGPQYRKNDEFLAHLFTDIAVTGTTFAAKTLQEAISSLVEKRIAFGRSSSNTARKTGG